MSCKDTELFTNSNEDIVMKTDGMAMKSDGMVMRMRRALRGVAALLAPVGVTALLSACSLLGGTDEAVVEYLPVQAEEGEQWGMMSPGGKMLFEEEFENEPTCVVGGHFSVRNREGEVELYKAAEQPEQVGESYVAAGYYCHGLCPVVREGRAVEYVDEDGHTAFTLEKAGGRAVTRATVFDDDGHAIFITDEERAGLIDTRGRVTVKAEYALLISMGHGRYIGTLSRDKDKERPSLHIIDGKGKELGVLKQTRWEVQMLFDHGSCFSVRTSDGKAGVVDEKGEWVVRATNRCDNIVQRTDDGHYVFVKDGKYGLMDAEGEVLVRAKYDKMVIIGDSRLAAQREGHDGTCELLTTGGEPEGEVEAETIYASMRRSGVCVAYLGDHRYMLIDDKGRQVGRDDFHDIGIGMGDSMVESDKSDFEAFVRSLDIEDSSLCGVALTMMPADGLRALHSGEAGWSLPEAGEFRQDYNDETTRQAAGITCDIHLEYTRYIAYDATPSASYFTWAWNPETSVEYVRVSVDDSNEKIGSEKHDRFTRAVLSALRRRFGEGTEDGSVTRFATPSGHTYEVNPEGTSVWITLRPESADNFGTSDGYAVDSAATEEYADSAAAW